MKKRSALHIKTTNYIVILLLSAYPSVGSPSLVSNEIPYQTFRDFATNKGPFFPGVMNIPIKDKSGKLIGALDKAPMPDFSSVNSTGIATLINPQYAVSVNHNNPLLFSRLSFAKGLYHMVDRDNIPEKDFSIIRLNKLVTETIPVEIIPADINHELFNDKSSFPVFYRIGSGTQEIKDRTGNITRLDKGYHFLSGGTTGSPYLDILGRLVTTPGDTFNPDKGPVSSFALPCDSGSPLFAWDGSLKKWLVVATLSLSTDYAVGENVYTIIPPEFTARVRQSYTDAPVINLNSKSLMTWRFDKSKGEGRIVQDGKVYAMHGLKEQSVQNGKDISFSGNGGVLLLQDDVNQGAGTLTFNHNYTIMPQLAQTWSGGGVNIASGAKVNWQVNGIEGDNLHKIGEGTLHVSGHGSNPGGLKVGDGTVVLAQQPDKDGNVQAFSSVNIASGRPRVILIDGRQLNPDTLSWGFRGGRLDVNGNSLTFHQLNAADYGAVLTNSSKKRANITLNYQRSLADILVREWLQSRRGTPGDLYSYQNSATATTDYFLLKSEKYSWFPVDQSSDQHWEFIGHDRQSAIRTAFERRKAAAYLFHGQFTDNLNIFNKVDASTTGAVALDGGIDISGNFNQEYGRLVFQGHPVIHAHNTAEIVEKLKSTGDNSLRTQPVSSRQPDWERRTFKLANLVLKDTHFDLARNASLFGRITAHRSVITLGSPSLYIDLNDGEGIMTTPQSGISHASRYDDLSRYQGTVSLADNSVLNIREKFTGGIISQQSKVNVASRYAFLDRNSSFSQTPLTLERNAKLIARAGWTSDSTITVGPAATLQLAAMAAKAKGQAIPSLYTLKEGAGYELQEGGSLRVSPFVSFTGDIRAAGRALVQFGAKDKLRLADMLTAEQQKVATMLAGFKNMWQGTITAPKGQATLTDIRWQMHGNSQVANLTLARSLLGFSGDNTTFNTLKVEELRANRSAIVLRTDLKESDRLEVSKKVKGQHNTLFLDLVKQPTGEEKLAIPLLITPAGTPAKVFKFAGYVNGFSQLNPQIDLLSEGGQTKWILKGFESHSSSAKTVPATRFLELEYKKFISLVNNLNKRMGELRNTRGQAGLWFRTTSSSGTGEGGYSDQYSIIQAGVDKKHRRQGVDLFTGAMVSYTNSQARSGDFHGDTFSYGGGLYASAVFDSGAYLDVIGKYIQHINDYRAGFAGPGRYIYSTHSWHGGLEAGYRYRLAKDLFVEPQAELVWGSVSGTRLLWQENGLEVSIRQKKYAPLIARAGVTVGKRFSGASWAVTVRSGVDYQFDVRANSKAILHDAWEERRTGRKKDGRMLYHVGLNGQQGKNLRIGLEIERSAFGRYNMNHAINANIRYSF